ncbi:uncharacterized protein LOC114355425 [Ostrinia furnacalis]|uniref:uncharacterized protein LOC114355425 n=1 Tax=Ostrinia furnacalis TaxID=93504 RepID=UPI00103DE0A1|nr:uncharacterized protein LOC114355425 [Ostrinia furnacalis]
MEAAERDAAAVERAPEGEAAPVHVVAARRGRGAGQQARGAGGTRGRHSGQDNSKTKCYACGAQDHWSDSCRYSSFVCGGCKQKGHLRRVCPKRRQGGTGASGNNMVAHVHAADNSTDRLDQAPRYGDDEQAESGEEDWPVEEELHQLSLNSYKAI